MRAMRGLFTLVLAFVAALGCQLPPSASETPPATPPSNVEVGSIALRLSLGETYDFATVSYDVSGNGFHVAADVDVRNSRTFSTTVGGIPFGQGYLVKLTALETSGKLQPCAGATTFNVTSSTLVPVTVRLSCREAEPPSVPVPPGAIVALGVLLAALGASRIGARRSGVVTLALMGAAIASTTGCLPAPEGADDQGELGLALQLAPGVALNRVGWTITGPNAFSRMGEIDTSHSTTAGALIPGLPAGAGYAIALDSTASDGVTRCAGTAPFDVMAGVRTPVSVKLLCKEAPRSGSAIIKGVLNICPNAKGALAAAGDTMGAVWFLGVEAHDADEGPSPLSYAWTTSGATLSDAHVAAPTLTCTSHGLVNVTVTIDDGDCADSATTQVVCPL